MDAILGQTSLAARDYAEHPTARACGTRTFWHPLHHSNFRGLKIPFRPNVQTVGVHTTHNDTELYTPISEALRKRFPEVKFLHIDPTARFRDTAGLCITPQQTDDVYVQLAELDVTVLRQAGCMNHLNCDTARRWFCDRYKTGSRLVNAFAAGLPAVIWREQGFLDVVAGSEYP